MLCIAVCWVFASGLVAGCGCLWFACGGFGCINSVDIAVVCCLLVVVTCSIGLRVTCLVVCLCLVWGFGLRVDCFGYLWLFCCLYLFYCILVGLVGLVFVYVVDCALWCG